MLVSVYLLRVRGRRLKAETVKQQKPARGDLRTFRDRGHMVAVLEPSMPRGPQVLSPLYEPRLVLISPQALRLMGFECIGEGEDATTYLQEWLCETG